MTRIDLTNKVSFDPTIEFEYFGRQLDFHNDYSCNKITSDTTAKTIKFFFLGQEDYFSLTFDNSRYYHIEFDEYGQGNDFGLTLDDFSKVIGIETNDGKYLEFNNEGQFKYFQLTFWGGFSFIIETEKCFLVKEDFEKIRGELDFRTKAEELRNERIELRKKYERLESEKLSGLLTTKDFIIEKQKIKNRVTEIRQVLGGSVQSWGDFKI